MKVSDHFVQVHEMVTAVKDLLTTASVRYHFPNTTKMV